MTLYSEAVNTPETVIIIIAVLKKILVDSGPLSICACTVLAGFTNHLF